MSRGALFLPSSDRWGARLASGLAAACVAGATAAAEDTFPKAATRPEVLEWLAGNSDLPVQSVVSVTDELVAGITARQDGRPDGSTRLTLREEVIDPEAAMTLGGRSVELELDLDCAGHRARLGVRRLYERPNLQGPVRITRPDSIWVEPPAGTVIDDVARSVCPPGSPGSIADPAPTQVPSPEVRSAKPTVLADGQKPPAPDIKAPSPSAARGPAHPPAGAAARQPDYAVQIATEASAELARERWLSLKSRFPDLIAPLTFAVEPRSAKEGAAYRALLLGFVSPSEAAGLCRSLRARAVDCVLRLMK